MQEEYFSFKFNTNPIQKGNESIFHKTNAFDNDNKDQWFEWQHNELDTDDSYEYEQFFKIKRLPDKYQMSSLAKYEYLKNIADIGVDILNTPEITDKNIFQDFQGMFRNERQKIKREKSIK